MVCSIDKCNISATLKVQQEEVAMKEVDLGKLSKTELRVFENINEMLQVSGHPERLRLLFQGGAEAVGFENLNPDGVKKFLECYTD